MSRWQLAAIGGGIALVVLVVSGFLLFESGGKSSSGTPSTAPPPSSGSTSYGHDSIAGTTLGGPFQRTVVVRVKNKATGVPLAHAQITIHGEMTNPHQMRLYDKKLQESTGGEYKGPYTFIMPGVWKVVVIATSKKGDTSTGSFPVHVAG